MGTKHIPPSSMQLPRAWILPRNIAPLGARGCWVLWGLLGTGSSFPLVLGKCLLASNWFGHLQQRTKRMKELRNRGEFFGYPKCQPEMKSREQRIKSYLYQGSNQHQAQWRNGQMWRFLISLKEHLPEDSRGNREILKKKTQVHSKAHSLPMSPIISFFASDLSILFFLSKHIK